MKSESVLLLNEDAKDNLDLPISREHKPMMRSLMQLFMFPTAYLWMLAVDGKFFSKKGLIEFEKRESNSVIGILNGILTAIKQISTVSLKEGELFSVSQLKTI